MPIIIPASLLKKIREVSTTNNENRCNHCLVKEECVSVFKNTYDGYKYCKKEV